MEAFLQQAEQSRNNKIKGCILPWIHLHGDIRGEYALCCHTDNYFKDGNIIRTGDSSQAPLEVWNGEPMRKARLQFLAGSYPEECSVCYNKEKIGIFSHRMGSNVDFKRFAKIQSLTRVDGSLPTPPVYLDFRFGNTCNFRCRMCGPDASTSWFKERHLSIGTTSEKASVDYWTNNEKFWNDFSKIIDNIDTVYFAGGEPFVQEGHYKLLLKLIDHGATNVKLRYNTNLSYKKFKNYDLKELWKHFDVRVWPSIDGYGDRVEYSRKGLDWKTFEENIEHYRDYLESLSVVSSVYTISSLPDLIKWIKDRGLNFHITNLTFPYELSSTIIPTDSKKEVMYKFRETLRKVGLSDYEKSNIVDTLKYMTSKDDSHLLNKFKSYTDALDKSRDESFVEVFPEFAKWYKSI